MSKFFVVSEEELEAALQSAYEAGSNVSERESGLQMKEAEATCRAREVASIGGGLWQREDWNPEVDEWEVKK